MVDKPIMTLEEVADYLRVSERTVLRLANSGELVGTKVGRAWRFKRDDVERYFNRNQANLRDEDKEVA